MKLLKFYLKYYLFHTLGKTRNIENVIQSHGFKIYEFDPLETNGNMVKLMKRMGCLEYSKDKQAFTYFGNNHVDRVVFIREGLSDADRRALLFHEEAHIWYDHPNVTGYTDQTDIQQEVTANLFEHKLHFLKATAVPALAGMFFIMTRLLSHVPLI